MALSESFKTAKQEESIVFGSTVVVSENDDPQQQQKLAETFRKPIQPKNPCFKQPQPQLQQHHTFIQQQEQQISLRRDTFVMNDPSFISSTPAAVKLGKEAFNFNQISAIKGNDSQQMIHHQMTHQKKTTELFTGSLKVASSSSKALAFPSLSEDEAPTDDDEDKQIRRETFVVNEIAGNVQKMRSEHRIEQVIEEKEEIIQEEISYQLVRMEDMTEMRVDDVSAMIGNIIDEDKEEEFGSEEFKRKVDENTVLATTNGECSTESQTMTASAFGTKSSLKSYEMPTVVENAEEEDIDVDKMVENIMNDEDVMRKDDELKIETPAKTINNSTFEKQKSLNGSLEKIVDDLRDLNSGEEARRPDENEDSRLFNEQDLQDLSAMIHNHMSNNDASVQMEKAEDQNESAKSHDSAGTFVLSEGAAHQERVSSPVAFTLDFERNEASPVDEPDREVEVNKTSNKGVSFVIDIGPPEQELETSRETYVVGDRQTPSNLNDSTSTYLVEGRINSCVTSPPLAN